MSHIFVWFARYIMELRPHEQDFSADTIIWDIQNAQKAAAPDNPFQRFHNHQ